jgi:hypothetical protein
MRITMMPRTTDFPRPRGGTGPRLGSKSGCSSEGGWFELMTCNLRSCGLVENAPWGELRRRRFAEGRHPGGGVRLVRRIAIDTWRTDRSKTKRMSMDLQRERHRHSTALAGLLQSRVRDQSAESSGDGGEMRRERHLPNSRDWSWPFKRPRPGHSAADRDASTANGTRTTMVTPRTMRVRTSWSQSFPRLMSC